MSRDAVKFLFQRPFQAKEFIEQSWFVARVSLMPTLLVAIPFTVLVSFTLNILLRELGAADLSGAGAAFGAVTQIGPLVTVLIAIAAVVTLIMGAEQPSSEPFSRTQHESAERIHMYDAQPVGIVQTGPAPQTIDYLQGRSEQRWVF